MTEYIDRFKLETSTFLSAYIEPHWQVIFFGLVMITILLLWFARRQFRKMKLLRTQLNKSNALLNRIQPAQGLEKNLDYLLEMISGLVNSPTYAFYTLDARNNNYVLKTVRQNTSDMGKVGPSYSGLTPYKKEAYLPPIALNLEAFPEKSILIHEGEVPLLLMPIQGGKGIVRMGPIYKVNKPVLKTLDQLSHLTNNVLKLLLDAEIMKNQIDVVVTSGKALQNISSITINPEVTLDIMLSTSIKSLEGSGGFFLTWDGQQFSLTHSLQMDSDVKNQFMYDSAAHAYWFSLIENTTQFTLKQGDKAFYQMPNYFSALGAELFYIMKISLGDRLGILVFWFQNMPGQEVMNTHHMTSMQTIVHNMEGIMNTQSSIKQLTHSYTDMLKMLARMMDNMNPYTVGYSDLMSRYAIVLARELNLDDQEVREIALSAYLSNVGLLGLSGDLFQKDGKFTESEFELMKLHSEVGAAIIQMTIGNKNIANNIMHHHERIDGNGYPFGLKGDEIPIGARIIAVVQTFLAKINGRKSREPMNFDQALNMLKSASDSQLDSKVVDLFVHWFEKKQQDPNITQRTLGSCWEMCCTPSSICHICPAYKVTDKNCFEFEDNQCAAHGKSCSTCFVYTEFSTREARKALHHK